MYKPVEINLQKKEDKTSCHISFLMTRKSQKDFCPEIPRRRELTINWVKDIKKIYSVYKVSQNRNSLSRLQFRREKGQEVIIPFNEEIEKIIENNHKFFVNAGCPIFN